MINYITMYNIFEVYRKPTKPSDKYLIFSGYTQYWLSQPLYYLFDLDGFYILFSMPNINFKSLIVWC